MVWPMPWWWLSALAFWSKREVVMAKAVMVLMCAVTMARAFWVMPVGDAALLSLGLVLPFSMIVYSRFWCEWLLPFGLMEYFARDRSSPERSEPAIKLIGWVILLLYLVAVFNY